MKCKKCGACCKFVVLKASVFSENPDGLKWLHYHGIDLTPSGYLIVKNQCAMLCGKECAIYKTRPDVCRRFKPGSEGCKQARKRLGLSPLT